MLRLGWRLALWSGWLLISITASGEEPVVSQWSFRSQYDSFNVVRRNSKYFIGKTEVKTDSLNKFIPFFNATINGECPKEMGKADAVVKIQRGSTTIERQFFFASKQVVDGDLCGDMDGKGLYYLPLHRSWLTGPDQGHISVGSDLKIEKENVLFAEFEKRGNEWRNKDSGFFTDWDFFNQFLQSLDKYTISGRIHPIAVEGSIHFQVTTEGKTYHFYKLAENLWAIRRPERQWLLTSPSFSFLLDMSSNLWRDRHSANLAIIKDSTQASDARIKAVQNLGASWSQAIKLVFYSVLTNPDEDPRLKEEISLSIRQKPSLENFGVLVQALENTEDPELLHQFTSVLRIRHRQGPLIDPQDSQEKINQSIIAWKDWWKKTAPSVHEK